MVKDPKMNGISRPIDQDVLISLCNVVSHNSETNSKAITIRSSEAGVGDPTKDIAVEEFLARIVSWNYLNDLAVEIKNLVESESLGYSDPIKDKLKSIKRVLTRNHQILKTVDRLFKTNRPDEAALLPEIHTSSIDIKSATI